MNTKTTIIKSLKDLVADRYLLILVLLQILLAITLAIIIAFSIHSSERQLISHYSAFGISKLYTDQWSYLLVFVFFGIIAAILQSVIAVKILLVKGHSLAIMFAWLGICVILLGFITALAVITPWILL